MKNLETARAFFIACDYGKGWEQCKEFCVAGASFETGAEILAGVDRMDTYCDWMADALNMFDDNVQIEVKSEAYDNVRNIALLYAEIRGNVVIGPAPMFAKTNYVYVIHFDGDKICHITKVWELKLPT